MSNLPFVTLSSFPAFAGVPSRALERIEELATTEVYQPGEKLIRKGDPGDRLYLLKAGTAYATVFDAEGVEHHDEIRPGEVVGEMALFTGAPRSADITARTEVHCLVVPFEPLRTLFAEAPDVAAFLTDIVGNRLMGRDGIRQVGHLTVDGPLGDGGFATVFAALDGASGERFAVKMLRHELVWRDDYAERFRLEAEVIQAIEHPNVVRVHSVIEAYATMFIVMDLVPGIDLLDYLRRFGHMEAPEVRYIFRRIAHALQAAHDRDIVHRDVKPANIRMTPEGDLKLLDFGVAITPEEARVEQSGPPMFVGTPHYAAPEHTQCLHTDGRTDLYMLAITCFELLTGAVPNADDTVMTAMLKAIDGEMPDPRHVAGIPEDLGELLYRCMRPEADDRFPSCADAVDFLDAFGEEERAPMVRSSLPPLPSQSVRDSTPSLTTIEPAERLSARSRSPMPTTALRTIVECDFTRLLQKE